MIVSQTSQSDGTPVRYAVAQFTPDPFRKEPRNVGVIVEKSGYITAKFLGETEDGKWALSRLRGLPNVNTYRLWVDHWRLNSKCLLDAISCESREKEREMFCVSHGGTLFNTGSDSPAEICNYLYAVLVSQNGLAGALQSDEPSQSLHNELHTAFKEVELFGGPSIRNKILANTEVRGAAHYHKVGFYQSTQECAWAMEPIDFTRKQKRIARDHAAYARYMFNDFNDRSKSDNFSIFSVAIVRLTDDDFRYDEVEKGMEILRDNCEIVNWLDDQQRTQFLAEREAIAHAA